MAVAPMVLGSSVEGGALRPLAYPGAFDKYLCTPLLADGFGNAFQFDFTALAGSTLVAGAGNQYTFPFAPCGIANSTCAPQSGTRWTYAPAVQFFDGTPPSGQCYDPANNDGVACTDECEILGSGPPLWSLLNASNGVGGGVRVSFLGNRALAGDSNTCPFDPVLGTETPRTVQIRHLCNPNLPTGTMTVQDTYVRRRVPVHAFARFTGCAARASFCNARVCLKHIGTRSYGSC